MAASAGEPWRDRVARERVGVDDRHAERGELRQAVGLPRRDAAGQRDSQHRPSRAVTSWRCAAATVFFSSIAIVSGPTPPGTGVSAPATSATAGMHVADDDANRVARSRRAAASPARRAGDAMRRVGHRS